MEAQQLIDAACQRTGESDFGENTWREGLDQLVVSLNSEAELNQLGRDVLADQITGILANRLQVESWHRRHPDIGDQPIAAPLIGLGLPRTGSTALSFLLSLDPARRSLRGWEAEAPCPPPQTATEHTDPRIAQTQAVIDMQASMFPDFVGMLPSSATGPQECLLPLAMEFKSMLFHGMARIPSYGEWLFGIDMESAYRYHRRVLQLLQWRCPPYKWWLKTPSHMHAIDELDRVYPDARFVMTHRDITQVIPSVTDVMSALSSSLTEHPDPMVLARLNADMWETALRRLITFRDAGNDDRFFDIQFEEMQADPMHTIRRLYAWLGEELSAEAAGRMEAWWQANSRNRHGARHHGQDGVGVPADELRRRFQFYADRFGVRAETQQHRAS